MSRVLVLGKPCRYEVRAHIIRDGKELEQTQFVRVLAGENTQLAFDFDQADSIPSVTDAPVLTKLTLNVPATAVVTLAGSKTELTGSVRTFTTTKLPVGSEWSGYRVQLTYNHEGEPLTREQTISLIGGEARSLTFDFDGNQLAVSSDLAAR